jgi:hypothetical protein
VCVFVRCVCHDIVDTSLLIVLALACPLHRPPFVFIVAITLIANPAAWQVRGFCDHNNFGAVGMAVPDRINLFRAEASRSVGGNGRRTSHNPPNPGMLDIYDRIGMVVMDENREFFASEPCVTSHVVSRCDD